MRKFKKVVAVSMAAMMLAGCFTACSKSSDSKKTTSASNGGEEEKKTLTLKVSGPQDEQELMKQMCEAFNAEHPNWDLSFEYVVCGEDVFKDEILKDAESAADVFYFANDQIPALVDAGVLSQIGGNNVETIKSDNSDSIYNSVVYNDCVYGVPFTPNTYFMFYDKTLLTEDDVKTLEGIMNKETADGVYNFCANIGTGYYLSAWYFAAGCTIFGADGTDVAAGCDWDSDAGTEATKYLVKLNANSKFILEENNNAIDLFAAHQLGAWFSGSWNAAAVAEALGDDMGVTKIPTANINGKDSQLKSFSGSKCVGVNAYADDQQVAVALAMYLANKDNQTTRFDVRGVVPSNLEVAASDAVAKDPVAAALALEVSEASVVQPLVSEMGQFWDPATSLGSEIHQGTVTEDNAAEKNAEFVTGFIKK